MKRKPKNPYTNCPEPISPIEGYEEKAIAADAGCRDSNDKNQLANFENWF